MGEYRLKAGYVDAATLLADDASIVSSFPNTGLVNPWEVASNGVISTYLTKTRTPSRKVYGQGLPSFSWQFSALNREQVEYLIDTIFAGALSADVTVMTYRFNNQSATGDARNWCVLQATAEIIGGQTDDTTDNVNDLWNRDFLGIQFTGGAYQVLP